MRVGTVKRPPLLLSLLALVALLTNAYPAHAAQPNKDVTSFTAYLAGQFAEHEGDWRQASTMLAASWQGSRDDETLRQAFLFAVGSGTIKTALQLGRSIQPTMPEHAIEAALLLAESARKDTPQSLQESIKNLPIHGISMPLSLLAKAWQLASLGKGEAALAALQPLSDMGGFETIAALHAALIAEATGLTGEADRRFKALAQETPTPRVAALTAAYFERHGQTKEAATMLKTIVAGDPSDVAAISVADALDPAHAPLKTTKWSLQDGMGEAFYDLAEILLDADHPDIALFYVQLSRFVQPQSPNLKDSEFLLGDIARDQGRYREAASYYNAIDLKAPFGVIGHLEAARMWERSGDDKAALVASYALVKARPALAAPIINLADFLHTQGQDAIALPLYQQILSSLPQNDARRPILLFSEGAVLDRLNQTGKAEKVLKEAAALAPDQPIILNYLAYLWAGRGANLERAQAMLEHARALAPYDARVTDSLGWVLYQEGNVKQAIVELEKAVVSEPADSTINQHLGDAYWQGGRYREAEFQWQRALLNADNKNAESLKQKLKNGLTPLEHQSRADAAPRILGN